MRKVLLVLVVIVLALPAALAAAQEADPPEGAMLIILDASGSMNSVDQDGVRFIDKAKGAVLELIDALPDEIQVGLRVYGHREPNTDAVRGCLDTELVAPVAPLDRDVIRAALDGIEASGFTPIGLSLTEAAADLPETGPRSIVLISDGEDTCAPPDPCQIAEDLFGGAFDVRIESVGFLVGTGSAAGQQLRCIAEVSGGGYRTVDDANALVATLEGVAGDLLDWRPPMTLTGALNQLEAVEIPVVPKADWVTDEPGKIGVTRFAGVLMPGETRWFWLDLWEQENFWTWVDLEWPPGQERGGVLETIIMDSAGNRVEAPVDQGEIQPRIELPGTDSPMVGAGLRDYQGWRPADTYLVGFRWEAPAEIFLGSLHVTVEVMGGDTARYEGRAVLEGSLDPADAPVLELAGLEENGPEWRGGQFRTPLGSGETRWYRLDMERGETMNLFALFPGDRYVGEGAEGELTVHLTDLDGNTVGSAFDELPRLSQTFGAERHQATVSGTTANEADPVPETVLIGFEWAGPAGQESELRFEVEATYDANREQMADQIESEGNQSESGGPDGEEQTDWSTTTSRAPATTTTTPDVAADDGDGGDGGGSSLPLFMLIGAAVVIGAGAPLLIRRLRG